MPKSRKPKEAQPGTVRAGDVDWAIIDKTTGLVLAVVNPQSKTARLRKAAISAAKSAGVSFTRIKLIPAQLMSPEAAEAGRLAEAPRLLDEPAAGSAQQQ